MEAHRQRRCGLPNECAGWCMAVSKAGRTGCVVLGDDLFDGGGKIDQEIILEVACAPRKVGVVFLCKVRNFVNQ